MQELIAPKERKKTFSISTFLSVKSRFDSISVPIAYGIVFRGFKKDHVESCLCQGDSVHSDDTGEVQSCSWFPALPEDWEPASCCGQPHGPQRYVTLHQAGMGPGFFFFSPSWG